MDRLPPAPPLLRARHRRGPLPDRLPRPRRGRLVRAAGLMYVELHAHSGFSFLDGASLPDELATEAARLGYPAMALTDHDGLWGSMEFAQSCAGLGVRPITGAELTIAPTAAALPREPYRGNCPPGCFHLTLLVEDAARLPQPLPAAHHLPLTHARVERDPPRRAGASADDGPRPRPRAPPRPAAPGLTLEALAAEGATEGLICLSGCARDGALAGRIARGDRAGAEALGRRLLAIFGPERFRVELQRPLLARRPGPQPAPRASSRGAAWSPNRRDRQRPLPPAPARAPAGRARRRPHARHARVDRAGAARQRRRLPRRAGADGGALRRAPRGGRRGRPARPSGCAST